MGIDRYRKLQSFDQTGNEKNLKPEVKKHIIGKLVKNWNPIPVFLISYHWTAMKVFEV